MSLYKQKFNPVSGSFNLVPTGTIITFKDGVANVAALPVSGNTLNDARITADTGHLYVWNGTTWIDQGDIIDLKWSAIDGKPNSSVIDIDDAVSKKHSNSLDHTQGTDQGLDTGGTNAVSAAQAKAGYSHSQVAHAPSDAVSLATVKADTDIDNAIDNTHAPHSDDQVIPDQLSDLSDDSTHRLVTDTEKSTWNEITTVALNVMLNAFRIAQIGSLTIFNMVKGFMDEYEDESGVDLINSINQTYNSIDDYYKNYADLDAETVLLLHLDNNVIDSELIPKIVTNNGVTFSSSTKKFGTYSAYFSGIDKYLTVIDSSDFDFDNGDFTIDLWVRFDNLSQDGYPFFCSHKQPSAWGCGYDNKTLFDGVNRYLFFICNSTNYKVQWTPSQDTWYYIAYVRNGADLKFFIDGTQIGTTQNIGSTFINSGIQDLVIGQYSPFTDPAGSMRGFIDELRISKGVARWTTNFIPPTSQYPISGDMILKSNAQVATIVPTDTRIILFEEDVDSVTINIDLKAYVSRDNGTTYSQITLADEGNYITGARILSGSAIVSSQPSGSNIKYKIETLNNKKLNLHGTAISWK